MKRALVLGLLVSLPGLVGCATVKKPQIATSTAIPVAAHVYVTRPLQLIPEPTAFVSGVLGSIREGLVLDGYDSTGVTYDLDTEALLEHLATQNERVPGTAAVHMTFVEAPLGFAFVFARVRCVVYDPHGRVLLEGDLDPPERRSLKELILPLRHPEVDGRRWGGTVWREVLSLVLPRRNQL
jgi:hypothetical protein